MPVIPCLWLVIPILDYILGEASAVKVQNVNVQTQYGILQGTRMQEKYGLKSGNIDTFDRFLGVPYAKPPTKERRFKPPELPEPWEGERDATEFGWICPQMVFQLATKEIYQNEDCLFVNIYSPYEDGHPDRKYPVIVYTHGGSYELGSGNLYDGSVLVQHGVVVVTYSYRLGALGFMTSGDSHIHGNIGILDQIQALKWVNQNIDRFRGDPNRVTLLGHSVGGTSVGLMLIMPQTEGLFHGVIAMSGSATASYAAYAEDIDHPAYVRQMGELFGCDSSTDIQLSDVVQCLREVPAQEFIQKRQLFPRYDPIDPEFCPLIDGVYIKAHPRELFAQGKFHRVPVIVGTVEDEFGNYFNGGARYTPSFDKALDNYILKEVGSQQLTWIARHVYTDWAQAPLPVFDRGDLLSDFNMVAPTVDMADQIAHHGGSIFQYHINSGESYHSVELNFLFGAPFSGKYADEMKVDENQSNFSAQEADFSEKIMTMWTNFAKIRYPILEPVAATDCESPQECGINVKSEPWQPFHLHTRDYLYLSPDLVEMRQNLRADKVAFWNQLIPKLKGQKGLGVYSASIWPSAESTWWVNKWVLIAVITVLLLLLLLATALYVRTCLQHHRLRQNLSSYGHNGVPTRV